MPVAPDAGAAGPAGVPGELVLTENDITDRPYTALGDIKVTVRKTPAFNRDPTRAQVDEKLRREGKKLGADAIVLVLYGTVGTGLTSWGVLHGEGRAVGSNRRQLLFLLAPAALLTGCARSAPELPSVSAAVGAWPSTTDIQARHARCAALAAQVAEVRAVMARIDADVTANRVSE